MCAGAFSLSGCLFADEFPVNVSVLNSRPEEFSAEMTLTDESDDVIFASELDIPTPEDIEDRKLINLEDVARVRDGERVSGEVRINDRTYETEQEVTCDNGRPTNGFRFVIYARQDVRGDGMDLQALSSMEGLAGSPC